MRNYYRNNYISRWHNFVTDIIIARLDSFMRPFKNSMCKRGYGKLITQIYLKQISSFLQIVVILKSYLLLLKIAVVLPDHDSNAWRQNMCIRLKQLIIRFDNSIRPRAINAHIYVVHLVSGELSLDKLYRKFIVRFWSCLSFIVVLWAILNNCHFYSSVIVVYS